ncbi:hypothetical protein BUALT_Bualt13G0094900 [Buddleja alternifolia]|uniref:N-acetyltransferase domain-containing protein n=1 Tax=Buddleja alternifolia TaxID=168488 RepID=A0AAV6WMT8_9LAMI|nr:hypothetical protein BUALT_Bualt13G0094900 [Buddleja alternifolia]
MAAAADCREPKINRKKLLLDEKVEVRSLEDGFLGSWHTGTVICCKKLDRVVQYDHLLSDDGSENLIEHVKVSPIVDGAITREIGISDNHRGIIRPVQPSSAPRPWCLHYGQCVDMFYEDAWWEGVIFDHEDGSDERRIFFPDMGDEMEGKIDKLRLSHDWDEVTEEWKPRGNWLFLELIEEVEQDWPLPVSVKQIWYELRMKNGFQKLGDWTSSVRCIWRELLLHVLFDNFRITIRQLFKELDSSWDVEELGQSLLEFFEPVCDSVLKSEALFDSPLAVVPFDATCQMDNKGILPAGINQNETVVTNEQALSVSNHRLPIFAHNPEQGCGIGSPGISTQRMRLEWQTAVPHLIPGPEFCPNAIAKCSERFRSNKRPSRAETLDTRKHLLHLDWKIEFADDKGVNRMRYFSPEKELFYSLRQICLKLENVHPELGPESQMPMSPNNGSKTPPSSPDEMLSSSRAVKSQFSSELARLPTPDQHIIEPEYCPEAVRDYYLQGVRDEYSHRHTVGKLKSLRAKKHLSAIGWSFFYHQKGETREMRYCSPNGKLFYSLQSACKWCVGAGALADSPTTGGTENMNITKDFDDHLSTSRSHLPLLVVESFGEKFEKLPTESSDLSISKGLIHSVEGETSKTGRTSRKKRKHEKSHLDESSPIKKRGRMSHKKIRGDSDASSSTHARRSKRVREMNASSSQQTPRTVLSLLIDNNVVLPRSKVQYRGREDSSLKAEGRIAREGIKCSCCGEIFSLGNFEAHAGSTSDRPSANIFLEDGRSLLECQLQMKRQHKSKNRYSRSKSREIKGNRRNKKNDYICSVCHYGGELVLCDQCPSSFHTHCLGLKVLPQLMIMKSQMVIGSARHAVVESVAKVDSMKRMKKSQTLLLLFVFSVSTDIFCGLRKILGKPVSVGTDNLAWTLVKYVKSDSCDNDASDDEFLVENYSKLNIALNVMHECFEPVKEPSTKSDLVEDVIFSRWSQLNRLNFQGFYTVLLEKNDELISAATVRIYGKRVAELPLIATRFQYRRLGMCRVLMDELEQKLSELGVERLVLPAVPSVLNTWTSSFGFSIMDESERLNLLDCTFLDFQGTVMCQKVLMNNLPLASIPSTGELGKSCDHVKENMNIEVDGNSTVSEVFQADRVEETDIVEQGSTCIATGTDDNYGSCSAQLAIAVDEPTHTNCSTFQTNISVELPVGVVDDKQVEENNEGLLKCYKRRRISAC